MRNENHLYGFDNLEKFSKNVFILYRSDINEQIQYSYEDIINEAKKFQQRMIEAGIDERLGVALYFKEHTPALCACLLGILNCNCFFCPLDYGEYSEEFIEDQSRKFGACFMLSDILLSNKNIFGEMFQCEIVNEKLFFYKISTKGTEVLPFPKNVCYCISTSGSTGKSKAVYVPYSCIAPNVDSLSNILNITSQDVVMLFAPISFDPFVIELFLTLRNGAALIVTSKLIRLNRNKLFGVMFPTIPKLRGATIFQMTSSFFRLLVASSIKDVSSIFDKSNSLRVLLLGGEEFPPLEEWNIWWPKGFCSWSSGKRIFNIYGITEVSCWSTIHECTPNDKRIPLGTPIDSATKLRIIDHKGIEIRDEGRGELQIGSASRKCFYSREEAECSNNIMLYRSTGDLVECDTNFKLFYIGRLINTFKRFGKMICLDQIAMNIKKILCEHQSSVVCDFDENNKELIAFIVLPETHPSKMQRYRILINQKLENHEKPDKIKFSDSLPLTTHGKECPRHVLVRQLNANKLPSEKFKEFLEESLGLEYLNFDAVHSDPKRKCLRRSLNVSFTAAGGTSFHALSLAIYFDAIFFNPGDRKEFINLLLNENVLLLDILKFLDTVRINSTPKYEQLPKITDTKMELNFVWKTNFEKCVDATPSSMNFKEYNCICVGSHACTVSTLNGMTGEKIAVITLPDRIESQVTFVSECMALVGCYDGRLYAFNFLQGEFLWEFNVGGMIKSKALKYDNSVIVSSYAVKFNLICICLKDQTVKWQKKIGLKGILATPLLLKTLKIIVCSLDGTYACVCPKSGEVFWICNLISPIFSNPSTGFDDSQVIIAEVRGSVNICSTSNGKIVCRYVVDGNIFSGICVQRNIIYTSNIFIMFGCHDHYFYCLKYNYDDQIIVVHWKYYLASPIYSTPKIFNNNLENGFICTCSTKGLLVILNIHSGILVARYDLKGEVFSSPCVSSDEEKIYIGCRDNFLYCLSLIKF